mmetsp:Transcript_20806/g.30566  ORF Transcript_20806/g.30566 Transcript_20806/m.30566 type:complete len:700 (-) Transcript_20806:55-2154(-)
MMRVLTSLLAVSTFAAYPTSAFIASPSRSHVMGKCNQRVNSKPSAVDQSADLRYCLNSVTLTKFSITSMVSSSPALYATKPKQSEEAVEAEAIYKPEIKDLLPLNTEKSTKSSSSNHSKLRQLKDRMWVREAIEDLTASEFATSLDDAAPSKSSKQKGNKAVDFENLLEKLDRRVEEMCVEAKLGKMDEKEMEGKSCYTLEDETSPTEGGVRKRQDRKCFMLKDGYGMGSVVYSNEQREALLVRLMATRQKLIKAMGGDVAQVDEDEAKDLEQIRVQLQDELADKQEVINKSDTKKQIGDPRLYIRDDGTVDWDGALQDRAALKIYGSAVWARINGEDPEKVSVDEEEASDAMTKEKETTAVTAKIVETEALREKKAVLDALRADFEKMDASHTALLNSAIGAGKAVATLNLATVQPAARNEIRTSYDALMKKKDEVSMQMLNYELERIFTYLESEMGNTKTKGYIPLQDRLNVAEFGMLESQISAFNEQRKTGDIVDADVLAVVIEQVMDLKRRLGIDYYVTGLTYDKEAIIQWLKDLLAKTKSGLAFYVKGCKLFWNDLVFCLALFSRALQGYTLKPREVRTLRRTFKDVITFIPVVIILLIPLSPVGHVLVFGAIQRVYPDFFPSCFTESRQNLLELYESTEYTEVTIDETWQEKLVRASEATTFVISEGARRLYENTFNSAKETSRGNDDSAKDA